MNNTIERQEKASQRRLYKGRYKALIIFVLGLILNGNARFLHAQPGADAIIAKMAQELADSLPYSLSYISWIHLDRKYDDGPALILSDRYARYVKVNRSMVQRQILTQWNYISRDSVILYQYQLIYCDTIPRNRISALKPVLCKDFPQERNGFFPALLFPGLLTISFIALSGILFYSRSGG